MNRNKDDEEVAKGNFSFPLLDVGRGSPGLLGAWLGEGYVFMLHAGECRRLLSALVEEECMHSSSQVESELQSYLSLFTLVLVLNSLSLGGGMHEHTKLTSLVFAVNRYVILIKY